MSTSPLIDDMSVLSFSILIEGRTLDDSLDVIKIEVNSKIGEIPSAAVAFSFQAGSALMAAMEELAPEKSIDIKMGYNGKDKLVFSGIITHQSVESTKQQRLTLAVHCHDKALALDQVLDNQLFSELTDKEIISMLVKENGLAEEVESTNVRHQRLSQFQVTDWDFIQARAKANDLLAYAENGKVFVKASATTSEAALLLTLSKDVIAFKLSTKANDLPNARIGSRNMLAKMGGVAKKSNLKSSNTRSSDATSTITGELTFFGNATPRLNSTIKLAGFGEQFNGKQLITGFHHLAEKGQWTTTVNIGPAPAATNPTAPQLPSIITGKVIALEGDPLGTYHILVDVPELDTTGAGIWSRLASFYATNQKGAFFLPEIGDEVLVGFEENDLAQPVVLGALYNTQNTPPYPLEDENNIKAILTRSGLKLEFDDENQQLTLATPANNTIVLSDDEGSIVISDQHGNQITMDSDGIKIKSCMDIELDAPGKIVAKANRDIDLEAQTSFSAQGNAQAEVKSSGTTTIQGSMVMIN